MLMLICIFIDQNPKFFFAHVLKKDVLLLCAYPMRKKLEIFFDELCMVASKFILHYDVIIKSV